MSEPQKRIPTFVFWLEIIVWLVIGYLCRAYFNQLTIGLSPAWLLILLKLVFFAVIIALAILGHFGLTRFLKSKGFIDR